MMVAPARDVSTVEQMDVLFRQLRDLSWDTAQKNVDLMARVGDLEEELAVWRQARSATADAAGREKLEYENTLSALKKRISDLEASRIQDSMILCAINGDEMVFKDSFLSMGEEGGRLAAQQLTRAIAEHLIKIDVQPRGRFSFWVSIFFDRFSSRDALVNGGTCTAEQLEQFYNGLSRASPRFLLVDVGRDRNAAVAKLNEYILTFSRFPQTIRIFLGGGQCGGYLPTITQMKEETILDKIILLCDTGNFIGELSSLNLPTLRIESLFRKQSLSSSSSWSSPLVPRSLSSSDDPIFSAFRMQDWGENSLLVPQPQGRGSAIDPKLPLHKQNPPPCNEHYLMSCSKGVSCKYSHDYVLSPEQLATLASNAKKAPCNYLRHGQECPFGRNCCWGHVCPKGPNCFHYSKGKCWFKGENMHASLSDAGAE